MLVYIQWSRANPVGWEPYDITKSVDVRKLPSKPEPTGGEVLDDDPGWMHGIMCQGVTVMGFDHYGPRMAGARIELVCWNDDPVDWPSPDRWAVVWGFENPRLDPAVGNRTNTAQWLTVYEETPGSHPHGDSTTGGPVVYDTWANFSPPTVANLIRHGIWVPSDCENCPHTADDHGTSTGSACTFADCAGYASLHQRHMDEMTASQHGWREWIG